MDNNNVDPVTAAAVTAGELSDSLETSPVLEEVQKLDLNEEPQQESHPDGLQQTEALIGRVKRSDSYEAAIPKSGVDDFSAEVGDKVEDHPEVTGSPQQAELTQSNSDLLVEEPLRRVKRSDSYEAAIPAFTAASNDGSLEDVSGEAQGECVAGASIDQIEVSPYSHASEERNSATTCEEIDLAHRQADYVTSTQVSRIPQVQDHIDLEDSDVIEEQLKQDCAESFQIDGKLLPGEQADLTGQILSLQAERSDILGTVENSAQPLTVEADIQDILLSSESANTVSLSGDCTLPVEFETIETESVAPLESHREGKPDCDFERRPSITPELAQTEVLGVTGNQAHTQSQIANSDFERRPSLTAETSHLQVLGITAESDIDSVKPNTQRRESVTAEVVVTNTLGISDKSRLETSELSAQRPIWDRRESFEAEVTEQPLVIEEQILPAVTQTQQASQSANTDNPDITLEREDDVISQTVAEFQSCSGSTGAGTLAPEELLALQIVDQVVQEAIEQYKVERDQVSLCFKCRLY